MVEVSNSIITALVLVTLVVAAAGTYVAFVNAPHSHGFFTGFATNQDSGNVTLTVNSTLAIQVDPTNSTINFGTCVPRGGSSYWCASNDAARCDAVVDNNCTGDNGSTQFIRVDNVGNIDANVTVDSTCDAASLIGGTGPQLLYMTTSCNGTGVASWASVLRSTPGQAGCTNVSFLGGKMQFYVNVTIPQDAKGFNGVCATNKTSITFTGAATS